MTMSPSYHVLNFSKLVQVMNQTNSKRITMSAEDARNLHSEIFAMLARIAELTEEKAESTQPVSITMDGGSFTQKS